MNTLFLGLSAGAAGPAMIVQVRIATAVSTTAVPRASGAFAAEALVRPAGAGASWSAPVAAPAWVTNRSALPGSTTPRSPRRCWIGACSWLSQWACSFRPTRRTASFSPTAALLGWYAAYLQTPVPGPGGAPVVQYSWPGTPGVGLDFPDPAVFVDCRAAVSTADAACTTAFRSR